MSSHAAAGDREIIITPWIRLAAIAPAAGSDILKLDKVRQLVDGCAEAFDGRGTCALVAGLVLEVGPVVGVLDQGMFRVDRLYLPAPEMPDWRLSWFSGLPR